MTLNPQNKYNFKLWKPRLEMVNRKNKRIMKRLAFLRPVSTQEYIWNLKTWNTSLQIICMYKITGFINEINTYVCNCMYINIFLKNTCLRNTEIILYSICMMLVHDWSVFVVCIMHLHAYNKSFIWQICIKSSCTLLQL
jgi:hypothetical protein